VSYSRPEPAAIPPALRPTAETTADKRVRRSRVTKRRRGEIAAPGLDTVSLSAKYGGDPGNSTRTLIGTFKVPMGVGWDTWKRYRNVATERFLRTLDRMGFVVERVVARPGVYPYRDVLTGLDDPAYREMQLVATGGYPKAKPEKVEIDPAHLEPTVLNK
jgi:hypothetical protein